MENEHELRCDWLYTRETISHDYTQVTFKNDVKIMVY